MSGDFILGLGVGLVLPSVGYLLLLRRMLWNIMHFMEHLLLAVKELKK